MADRSEVYVVHKETGRRVAVPKTYFEGKLKGEGYVIDPNEINNAAVADTRTVKAAERTLARAEAKKTDEAEG